MISYWLTLAAILGLYGVCVRAWKELQGRAARETHLACPLCLCRVEMNRTLPVFTVVRDGVLGLGDTSAFDERGAWHHAGCLQAVREARAIYAYLEKR